MGATDLSSWRIHCRACRVDGKLCALAGTTVLQSGRLDAMLLAILPGALREELRGTTRSTSRSVQGHAPVPRELPRKGGLTLSFGAIPLTIATPEELLLPTWFPKICNLEQELVL